MEDMKARRSAMRGKVGSSGNRVRCYTWSSNSQGDGLREPARPILHLSPRSRRYFRRAFPLDGGETNSFQEVQRAEHLHRSTDGGTRILLKLGEQRIHHGCMIVRAFVLFVMIVREGMILVLVASRGMRAMTVIHLCHKLHATAVAHETPMQPERLRPAHRKQCDEAENEPLWSEELHDCKEGNAARMTHATTISPSLRHVTAAPEALSGELRVRRAAPRHHQRVAARPPRVLHRWE